MRNGIFEETKYATSKTKPSFATNPIAKTPIKPANSKHFGGGVAFKALSVALLAGLGINGAFATTVDEAMATKPLNTPTLDHLNASDIKVLDPSVQSVEVQYVSLVVKNEDGSTKNFTSFDGATPEDFEAFLTSGYYITLTKAEEVSFTMEELAEMFEIPVEEVESFLAENLGFYDYDPTIAYNNTDFSHLMLPVSYPESAYTLTKVENKADNTVTKFEYDNETGQMVPVYYQLDLRTATYGTGSTTETLDFSAPPLSSVTVNYDLADNTGKLTTFDGYDVSGNWYKNTTNTRVDSSTYSQGGAAITNKQSVVGNVNGNFIGNAVTNGVYNSFGGAIFNFTESDNTSAKMGNIVGDFIGNSIQTYDDGKYGGDEGHGGAIANTNSTGVMYRNNRVEIGNITGDFVGNYIDASAYAYGGAIYNYTWNGVASIGDITGNFIGNSTKGVQALGGAIYNYAYASSSATIGDITGDFIGNYAESLRASTYGGAIYNYKQSGANYTTVIIGDITGDFIGNYAFSSVYGAYGGAIHNSGTIGNVTGDFIANYAAGTSAEGGAISSRGYINTTSSTTPNSNITQILANFIGNYAKATTGNAIGGAVNNNAASIDKITGDFISNSAISDSGTARGGAISVSNFGEIDKIKGDFVNNTASGVHATGGAISEAPSSWVIYTGYGTMSINDISGDFVNNKAVATTGDAQGGAIYSNSEKVITNSSFVNNSATSETGKAQGGAIYSSKKLTIVANNAQSLFENNTVKDSSGEVQSNAIYMAPVRGQNNRNSVNNNISYYANSSTLELRAMNNGEIVMNDKISGIGSYRYSGSVGPKTQNEPTPPSYASFENYKISITGDNTGVVYLNNDIEADDFTRTDGSVETGRADVSLDTVQLRLGVRDNVLDDNNLTLNSGTLNMINNQVGVSALHLLTVAGDTNFVADVDLEKGEMDRIEATNYGSHSGNLNVAGMNLLSDAVGDNTSILFAENGLKDNVRYGAGKLPNSEYQTTAYTPIYKYNIKYDNRDDAGYFMFTRGAASSGNQSDAFNPAVLGSSTSATVGAIGTMNNTFNHAFGNADNFMNIPYLERISMRDRNKYALSVMGDNPDLGRFSPLYQRADETASAWVKPYASFETVGLKNGPKVHNNTYGTLVGFDTEMQSVKNGWDRVITGYIGYNGASQRYSGVDSTQNGGLVGGTVTMYKGNFFNATTVSVGASVAQNQNMYGSEDYALLLSGIGNKTGYNFEFKEGKVILQPSMLMSYTFVNTFDYTNSAGVRIDNKPLHAIQLAPGVKVIGNLKGGWQPYASAQMVWNLMGESKATANGVKLPEMSIKPYVQYGVGLQKRFKDRCMAYGQAMIQNGGRNGISLTAGFRWALGKEGKPIEKVQGVNTRHSALDAESKKILNLVQNDRGKYNSHSEGYNQANSASAKLFTPEESQTNLAKDSSLVSRAQNDEASLRGAQATWQSITNSQGILRSTQNDSKVGERKVLKQLTPAQKAALTGKRQNTTITAKSGILRQY